MADQPQERKVGLRVRVGVGRIEVDALALGQLAHRLRLALAIDERAVDAAGIGPVDDLGPGADRAVEAQHDGEDLRQLRRRRGADVERAPGVLVVVGDPQHLVVNARQDSREHVGAEAQQVALAHAFERLAHALAHGVRGRVCRAAQAEGEVRQRVAQQGAAGHEPGLVRRPRELEGGGPRHEGPVEVEEGGAAAATIRR